MDVQPPATPDAPGTTRAVSEVGTTPELLAATGDDAGLTGVFSAPRLDRTAEGPAAPDTGASRGFSRSIVPEERDLLREAEPTLPPGALDPEVMDAIGSALRRPAARRPSMVAPLPPPAPEARPTAAAYLDPVEASFFRPDPPVPNPSTAIGADLEAAFLGEPSPESLSPVTQPPIAPDPAAERDALARTLHDGLPRRAVAGSGESDRVTYRPVQPAGRRSSASRILLMLVAFALLVGIGAAGAWWVRRPSAPTAVATGPDRPDDASVVTPMTSQIVQVPEGAGPDVVAVQTEPADVGAPVEPSTIETPSPEPAVPASQPASPSDAPVALANAAQQRTEPPATASPSVAPAALFARAASLPSDQGLLMIVSDRPGAVYVDGRPLGDLSALGPLTLTAGIHRVRVVTAGTDREADARVDAGQVRAIQFRFGATGARR